MYDKEKVWGFQKFKAFKGSKVVPPQVFSPAAYNIGATLVGLRSVSNVLGNI